MSEFSNPYRPGEPVADPEMLFGRQDAADWIDLQIASGSRTMVLSALPLVGKTSFLRHVDTLQNQRASSLLVSLSELPSLGGGKRGGRAERDQAEGEQTLNTVLRTFLDQILPQLTLLRLIHDDYLPTSPRVASALRELFTVVSRNLSSDQPLLLYVDDLHLLVKNDLALVSSFLTSLLPLLDECPALRLVFAVNQDKLQQIRHSLLDGAPIYQLGTLPTDASINMVTIPVKGILRFDYGVTKRIAEVNSHHPYYLSLYCYTLLNRQVHDGWVNQQDFDTVLAEILDSPIEPFTRIWDQSTWAERAVLAGMAAIQGAHGPITGQEVIRYLQRQKPSVDGTVVQDALNTLAERSVLTPMGAVSYRFQVELLRFWLREHTDPAEIIEQVNWSRAASDLKPARKASRSTPHRTSPTARRARKARPRWIFPALGGSLFLCILLAATGLFATRSPGTLFAFFSSTTPTPTATPGSDITPLADAPGAGTPDAPAEPTPTPSPTPAIVVARTLPSITYMGRDVDENWRIYVMDADGSNQTALTSGEEGDDASPIWSADGQRIAFVSRRDGNREIYVMDATGENVANVTRHPADDWTPAWSPDGTQLAFSSFRDGSWEIFIMDTACLSEPASCPNALTQLTSNGQGNLSPAWSPDGTRLAFNNKANDNWDVYTMSARGADVRQITTSPENDLAPVWSPDGSLIAFESNREGNVEVYVIGANGGTARNISNLALADDHGPTWSPDGQQLVFYSNREGNWDIFAAPLAGGLANNLSRTPARDEQTPAWRP